MSTTEYTPEVVYEGEATTIVLKDDIDLHSVRFIRQTILGAAENHGKGEFRVNLSAVEYIDSAGLELLLTLVKVPAIKGRLVVVVAPKSHPERVLKLTRIDMFLTVVSTGRDC